MVDPSGRPRLLQFNSSADLRHDRWSPNDNEKPGALRSAAPGKESAGRVPPLEAADQPVQKA